MGLNVKIIPYSADVECVPEPEYEDKGACSRLLGIYPTSFNDYVFTKESALRAKHIYIPPGGRLVVSGMYPFPQTRPLLQPFFFGPTRHTKHLSSTLIRVRRLYIGRRFSRRRHGQQLLVRNVGCGCGCG